MNYKLEKFWNYIQSLLHWAIFTMNYKLEKFWNENNSTKPSKAFLWTINLKSFEILDIK